MPVGDQGYEVEVGELDAAADAARSAADQVGHLAPGPALRSAGAGIPGADAVAVMDGVADRWQAQVSAWCAAARGYAGDLTASARTYRHSDAQARHDFSAIGSALGGPK